MSGDETQRALLLAAHRAGWSVSFTGGPTTRFGVFREGDPRPAAEVWWFPDGTASAVISGPGGLVAVTVPDVAAFIAEGP